MKQIITIVLILCSVVISAQEVIYSGSLGEGRSSPLKGDWQVVAEDDTLVLQLGSNFRARRGPDLKVYLSKLEVEDIHDRNAGLSRYSYKLGALKSFRGSQEYIIPSSIDINEYTSWIVHCEAYSHFWDGANLVSQLEDEEDDSKEEDLEKDDSETEDSQ